MVFILPANLEASIRKKDYDQAVRDYRKAKAIVGSSEDEVVKDIWQRIQALASSFRLKLFNELNDATLGWDVHEKILG